MPRSPLCKLPNIWPKIADNLIKIWIATPEEFLAQDPYEVFHQLKIRVDPSLCRCALAGIIGAHKGIRRNLIREEAVKTYEQRYPDDERRTSRKGC